MPSKDIHRGETNQKWFPEKELELKMKAAGGDGQPTKD
jgi:hypothetical protein